MATTLGWTAASNITDGEYNVILAGSSTSTLQLRHAGGKDCGDLFNAFDVTDSGDMLNRWTYLKNETAGSGSVTYKAGVVGGGGGIQLGISKTAGAGNESAASWVVRPLKKIYDTGDDYWFATIYKDGADDSYNIFGAGLTQTLYPTEETGANVFQYGWFAAVYEISGTLYARSFLNTSTGSGSASRVDVKAATAITATAGYYIIAKCIHTQSDDTYRTAWFEGQTIQQAFTRAEAWTSGSASALTGYLTEGSVVSSATISFAYYTAGYRLNYDESATRNFYTDYYGMDGDVCHWYVPHFGNANDCGLWNTLEVPSAGGQTKNGWTFTLDGGAASTGALYNSYVEFSIKRENSETKVFGYTHDTDQTITQDSTSKYIFGKFSFGANNVDDAWRYGFFNSTTNDCATNGHSVASNSSGNFFTCINGVAGATTTATFTADTDYWIRLEIDEGTSYLDIFTGSSTRSTVDAGRGAGDVDSNTRDISSATISCDEVGLRNTNRTGANATMTMKGYETEGNAHAEHADGVHDGWYPDVIATGDFQQFDGASLYTIDYSTFSATQTGDTLFRRKLDTDNDGTADDLTGAWLNASGTAALSAEDAYGMLFEFNLDPTDTTATVTVISLDGDVDTEAPDVDYLLVRKNIEQAYYAVGYEMSDNSEVQYGEIRVSDDGGSTFKIVDWNDTTKKKVGTDFASYTAGNSYKILNEGVTQDPSPIVEYGDVTTIRPVNLGYSSGATLLIQVRATDVGSNASGWVTATDFGTTPDVSGKNEIELLEIIAQNTSP